MTLAAVQTDIDKGRMWKAVREEEDCRLVKGGRIRLWVSLSARRSDSNSLSRVLHTFTHVHTQTHSPICLSFHCEATGLLNRSQQLVVQLVIALVGRNVNPVEAAEKKKTVNSYREAMTDSNVMHVCLWMHATHTRYGLWAGCWC